MKKALSVQLLSAALAVSFALAVSVTAHRAHAESLGPNLVPNPSVESGGSGVPTSWAKGGYGSNTRILTYPASPGHTGAAAARVAVSNWVSGDAKWYFTPVAVQPNTTYQFTDYYSANAPTEVDVQITRTNGTQTYIVLGHPASSAGFAQFSARFTTPADAASVTVFHVMARNGTLTVDDYALNKVIPDENLIRNGDFETAGSGGLPLNWRQGGWGTNTRTFYYPVVGASGHGARVSITSYTSGDAKWYFTPIFVPAGTYSYEEFYAANVPSVIVAQIHNANGSYSYNTLKSLPAASGFMPVSAGLVVPSGTLDVTIFHLIKQVGTLAIDNASLVRTTSSGGIFSTGAVTLTFDNGWLSHYTTVFPKLSDAGFPGTFYIITHELSDYGFPGFVSKQQIQEMYAGGMEIGSHTQTHPHMTTLSASAQEAEISGAKQDLLALSVGPVESFAYPFGEYNATTLSLVQKYHLNARTTANGFASVNADRYQLPRLVVLNTTTLDQMKGWVDEAERSRVWAIIEFHQVDTSGDTYATTPTIFNGLVDYLTQKGLPVVTMHEGVASLQ